MRFLLKKILIPLSIAVLKKYHPLVIAVTGTVGKTSAKQAIAVALSSTRTVRPSEKNNNTEIGCAITILGMSSPGRSVLGWFGVFAHGIRLLLTTDQKYPSALVLEFGAQTVGDIARLCALFPPTVGVLTTIGATHAVGLGGIEGVIREKSALIASLPQDGFAIINADDDLVLAQATKTRAKVLRYGFSEKATVRGLEAHPMIRRDETRGLFVEGMTFKIEVGGSVIPAIIPGVLGMPTVSSALAGVAVANALGANPLTAIEGLQKFVPEKGHLRVIDGIKYATLIDDSYNASTKSMIEALRALRSIPLDEGEERIAVLGDMREMGALSEQEHAAVGKAVFECGIDRLVTVGEMSRDINRAARAAGIAEECINHFPETEAAGKFVQSIMERGDIVLIKGSRGMHMEAVVKELMAEPLRAQELLEWGEPTT
jgi:UDP-N-acetylmuramoyl-tripeptide--D-alanyl-D-alanine ligase